MQVTATDGDKDRPENIVYFLTGQGIDTDRPDQSKFDINKTTGEIFVLKVTSAVVTSLSNIYLYLHYVPLAVAVHAEIILLSPAHLLRLHNIVSLGLNINCIIFLGHTNNK